jgi:ATP-dependent Clp protease adaptor protein ClpS
MSGTKIVHIPEKKSEEKTSHTPLYKVLIHDDPKTQFHFVIGVLIEVFKLEPGTAHRITLHAHYHHVALVKIETKEYAEFHIDKAHSLSRTAKFPLTFSMEPA